MLNEDLKKKGKVRKREKMIISILIILASIVISVGVYSYIANKTPFGEFFDNIFPVQVEGIQLPAGEIVSDYSFADSNGVNAKVNTSGISISKWETNMFIPIQATSGFLDNNKITLNSDSFDSKIYMNDSETLEWEIIFKLKPKDNFLSIPINTKDLDFYYQPPLNEQVNCSLEDCAECNATDCRDKTGHITNSRPENVVGSYAVYHSSKTGNEYGTGKAFHIYRPLVTDSKNNSVWADLSINKREMRITIPQDFLDKAVYPIVIDPSFGYSSVGASHGDLFDNMRAMKGTPINGDGAVDNINYYIGGAVSYGQCKEKGAIYTILGNLTSPQTAQATDYTAGWHAVVFTNGPTVINGTTYYITMWGDREYGDLYIYYDFAAGTTLDKYKSLSYTGNFPDPAGFSGALGYKYAIYANYTVSAGDVTAPAYSLNSTNSTLAGTAIKHNLYWTDTALAGYIFSWDNGTGTLVNDSWVSMTGATNWSNVTKAVNSTVSSTIKWCIYCNDTAGNLNGTSCATPFSYVTTEAPANCWTYDAGNKLLTIPAGCLYSGNISI